MTNLFDTLSALSNNDPNNLNLKLGEHPKNMTTTDIVNLLKSTKNCKTLYDNYAGFLTRAKSVFARRNLNKSLLDEF